MESIVGNLGELLRDNLSEDRCEVDVLELTCSADTVEEGPSDYVSGMY